MSIIGGTLRFYQGGLVSHHHVRPSRAHNPHKDRKTNHTPPPAIEATGVISCMKGGVTLPAVGGYTNGSKHLTCNTQP